MTTVSDAFDVATPVSDHPERGSAGGGTRTRVRARVPVTVREIKFVATGRRMVRVVHADLANAWPWRGSAPTLRDLWLARKPSIERVPGRSKTLHRAWIGANHAALIPTAYLSTLLWSLQHPARWPLAAALLALAAIPLYWIFG